MVIKIVLESLAIAVVLKLVTKKPIAMEDILRVTLVTAAVLTVLAVLAPEIQKATKQGIGMGIGLRQVGFEGYADQDSLERYSSTVEGFDEDAKKVRMNNVLYSGDLVIVAGATPGTNDNLYMQRSVTSSEVLLNAALDGVHTNLSKLRFELVDHDPDVSKPIKFGDTVYFKHNANINNQNLDRFIKISDNLLSHQTGPLFNQFQIINSTNPQDKSYVRPDTPIVLMNLKSGGIEQGYLKVGSDKKFTNGAASAADATKLSIGLQRVAEADDKHLCICLGDTLYP